MNTKKERKMYKWNSLAELWALLNDKTEYVILRNFENLNEEISLSIHPDIDFLCSNRNVFLSIIKSEPRNGNLKDYVHRVINVGGKNVDIDIRCVGDGYYDEMWEKEILKTRILSEEGFYIPSNEHYFYSLLYHVLIQKKTISKDYEDKLLNLAKDVDNETDDFIISVKVLQKYMKTKGFYFTYPENSRTIANFGIVDKSMIKNDLYKKIIRAMYNIRKNIKRQIYGRKN